MSTGLYYRRWTRMYIHPAAKYFHKYDTLDYGMQNMMFLANRQNPVPENKRYATRMAVNHEQQINNKLIKNLFLKYPDLKYESINRLKYHGDNFNSYSYSFAFITQQKKLMKAGYTMRKAFELVQQKFQQKMKRKIDQSLISRGLAIGNRARSLLTIYQQQVENESRLKMLRTRRQVLKYEQKLKQIDEAIKRPIQNQEIQVKQNYQRIFDKISEMSREQINKEYQNQKRSQLVQRMENQFKDMFSQFYQIAGYKDRLRGLTDDEIKQNIRTSPNKIKRLTRELVKYLKNKGGITISPGGELKINDNINQKLKSFLYSSPTVKIAILNHMIGYQNPNFSYKQKLQNQAKSKLSQLRGFKKQKYDKDETAVIKQNKIREMQTVVQKNIPDDNNRSYRLLESAEERILRLQIKYLQSFLSNPEKADQSVFQRLNQVIEEFRRLKFRMEKRFKSEVEGELMFPEHKVFNKHPKEIEDRDIEYEDLLEYLRRKTEERRLKAIDQVDDNKISEMIKKQPRKQIPKSQSEQHSINN